jgi:hypothetical protein
LPHSPDQIGTIHFDPASLTTLIDPPLMCRSIMRESKSDSRSSIRALNPRFR